MTAVLGGAGYLTCEEALTPKLTGITTPYAHYIFDYEIHTKGISPERIPKQRFDAFVREGIKAHELPYLIPISNTDQKTAFTTNEPSSNLYFMLDKCAKEKTSILGVDITINPVALKMEETRIYDAINCIISGLYFEKLLNRREFTSLFSLIGSWAFSHIILEDILLPNKLFDQESPSYKIFERLYGYMSEVKPVDLTVFFRNLIWAYKTNAWAQSFFEEKGRKAEIYSQQGAGHKAFEDFIRLDTQTLLSMILLYPNLVLQNEVKPNIDTKHFSSTLKLDIEPDFHSDLDANSVYKQTDKFHFALIENAELEKELGKLGIT